jgi:lipopolysaccharide export system protein LptC
MDTSTLPRLLVYLFPIGGVFLIVFLLWTAQKAMTAAKDRPQYKREKIVKDYFAQEGKQINYSAISTHLAKRWKENAESWND